ncbi:MAG: S9 family peptidase [Planctomycetaceae bacterium]|nr:S9 family peptidase [Planctomycetaceae bacterium]MBP62439.1 S9 family peptidase [Planctomycetaceae bacterium]
MGCGVPAGTEINQTEATSVDGAAQERGSAKSAVEPVKHSVPLIPRQEFFGNPDKARARISPDGTKLALIAPLDGVLNVWVGPADDLQAIQPVTHDTHRGVVRFFWAYTSEHLIYLQDIDGNEDHHAYSVNLETDEIKDLTPIAGIKARIQEVSERFPEEILVGVNDREGHQLHDVYRVNIVTGQRELVQHNPGFAGFITDDNYQVRLAQTFTSDGGQLYLMPDKEGEWREYMQIGSVDAMTTGLAGFDKAGSMFLLDSRGRNTAALKLLDLETGEETLLAENERADLSGIIAHPTEKHVQAVTFTYARREWQILDESIRDDINYLKEVAEGEIQITSRTLNDKLWTVAFIMDHGPVQFYLYDREQQQAEYLFSSRRSLENLPLVRMHAEVIPARDGLELVSYLSLPSGTDPDGDARPSSPQPLVLLVHGGPWSRDSWGFDPTHQLLANRGYAVLSVNYRGSTGFGKNFVNAADREWAGKMHLDLMDAVNWSIAERISDPDRIAIMGGSYGGYATLVGLTFTPEIFACGVDVVGPSSLLTLLENPPPYWMTFMPVMKKRVGDHTTEEGRKFLKSRSPLFLADKIKRPLLIGQGANDPRVKQMEADQIVKAMEDKNIPVTYMLFQDEGHGFARPENRLAFNAVTEAFLAEHLGGRYEPIGDTFEGAVFTVPSGARQVPGLQQALQPSDDSL